jgi:trans-aconitate 2-methyltransferase
MTEDMVNAEHYSRNSEIQKKIATDIFSYHRFSTNEKILDLGCGDGYVSSLLSEHGEVLGVDSSNNMIAFARSNYLNKNLSFLCSKIENYHTNERYSLITAFNSIYWCKDLNLIFTNLHRLLNSKGKLLLVTYPKESPYWTPFIETLRSDDWVHLSHKSIESHWITENQYLNNLSKHGFNIIHKESSINNLTYKSRYEFLDYIKGWIPCFLYTDKVRINKFMVDVSNRLWREQENNKVDIAFKKLVIYAEKQS